MKRAILDFPKQFVFWPKIENVRALTRSSKNILIGMGGSHLAGDVLKSLMPELHLQIHSDYGLPKIDPKWLKENFVILSSYSGNTEETVGAFLEAKKKKLSMAAITVGGKLLGLAKKTKTPYIQLPDTGIQPRMALGFGIIAILELLGDVKKMRELGKLSKTLRSESYERAGISISSSIKDMAPVIYASMRNEAVAKNWKIKFNETGKIPAFWNVLPEMNHNEMTGFDAVPTTKHLSEKFVFLFLRDKDDGPKIGKRMEVMAKLFKARRLIVETIDMVGKSRQEKVFGSLITADWAAYYTALGYGLDPEQVPMVEEFKKLVG